MFWKSKKKISVERISCSSLTMKNYLLNLPTQISKNPNEAEKETEHNL